MAIFHEPVDYSLVELFEKSMPLPNTVSTQLPQMGYFTVIDNNSVSRLIQL